MWFGMNSNPVSSRLYRRHLPHRHRPDSVLFLTWRLGDSLPVAVVERSKRKRELWLQAHPKPWTPEITRDYHRLFTRRIERWLDRGVGCCCLRDPEIARIVGDALLHFDGDRWHFYCAVVMPNHVHALVQLIPDWPLAKISQSVKGFTAREINRRAGRAGSLWQQEVWDRIVRNAGQFEKYREYILHNPVKARLRQGEYLIVDKNTRPPADVWG
jgi:hypothetical protein